MANMVKHGELTVEQMSDIQKNLLVNIKREPFWGKFCSHQTFGEGHDAIEWRKLILADLTPADIVNLTEGHTPDPKKMVYAKYKSTVVNFGNYIEYTDESKRYNFDDVVRDAKVVLSDDSVQQLELRKGNQFVSGTCTMTHGSTFLADLLKAKIILKKNGGKPVSAGKFICIMPSEISADVLTTYKDSITHTSQKEALIEGYLGELGGFILYDTTSPVIYKANGLKGYVLFIAKSRFGLPVGTISIGSSNVQTFDDGLGSVPEYDGGVAKPDALHQRGTVGYKVMGFGTRIIADECVLRMEMDCTAIVESVNPNESSKSHYQGYSESPSGHVNTVFSLFNASTGAAIASGLTITLKKGATQGSGDAVSAETDGSYNLDTGKYNFSIAGSGYTTKTGIVDVTVADEAHGAKAIAVLVATAS